MYMPSIRPIQNPSLHLMDSAKEECEPWGDRDDYQIKLERRAARFLRRKKRSR